MRNNKTNSSSTRTKERRAWKCRVVEETATDDMAQCCYISRRTRLHCKNLRPKSALTKEGFCEVHPRFFQQLRQMAKAEQRRNDQGFYSLANGDEDGSIEISDIDETFVTTSDWPFSQQDLYNELHSDDDEDNPLKNAGIVTEEEILVCKLAILKRKRKALRDLRQLLYEKSKRRAIFFKKKIAEEAKKGPIVAYTKNEKRLKMIHKANKKYRRWQQSFISQYMNRRLARRQKIGDDPQKPLDYLKVHNANLVSCSFRSYSSTNKINGEAMSGEGKVEDKCQNPALPLNNFCIKHILRDSKQSLFTKCNECENAALHFEDRICYCFKHSLQRPYQKIESLQSSSSTNSVLLQKDNLINKGSGKIQRDFDNEKRNMKKQPFDKNCSSSAISPKVIAPDFPSMGQKCIQYDGSVIDSRNKIQENVADVKSPPVKVVLIGEDDDLEENRIVPSGRRNNVRTIPVSSPPPAAGIPSRTIPFERQADRYSINSHMNETTTMISDIKQQSMYLQRKEDSEFSCARVRPFVHAPGRSDFRKMERSIPQRFIAVEKRNYNGSDYNQQSPIIQRVRMSGPKKFTSFVFQTVSPQNPSNSTSIDSMRRASISANSNFTQPSTVLRSMPSGTNLRGVQSDRFTDPSTITLGPTIPLREESQTSSYSGNASRISQYVIHGRPQFSSLQFASGRGNSFSSPSWPSRSPAVATNRSNPDSTTFNYLDRSKRTNYEEYQRRQSDRNFPISSARTRLIAINPSSSLHFDQTYQGYISNFNNRPVKEVLRLQHGRFAQQQQNLQPEADVQLQGSLETAAAVASISSALMDKEPQDDEESSTSANQNLTEIENINEKAVEETHSSHMQTTNIQSVKTDERIQNISQNEKNEEERSNAETSSENHSTTNPSFSAQQRNDGSEDGLTMLAMAAESCAANETHEELSNIESTEPSSVRTSYLNMGLEQEDDED